MKIGGLECLIRVLLSVVKRPRLVRAFLSNLFANTTCLTPTLLLLWLVILLTSTMSIIVV